MSLTSLLRNVAKGVAIVAITSAISSSAPGSGYSAKSQSTPTISQLIEQCEEEKENVLPETELLPLYLNTRRYTGEDLNPEYLEPGNKEPEPERAKANYHPNFL
jgi:hypothetical protein